MDPNSPRSHRSGGASSFNAVPALVAVLVVGVILGWAFLGDDGPVGIGPTSTTLSTSGPTDPTDSTDPTDTTDTTDPEGGTTTVPGAETTTTAAGEDLPPLQGLAFEPFGTAKQPTSIFSLPGDDRVFVAERFGQVRVFAADGTSSTFLDLTDRVLAGGIEQGLLGLTFHPEYATNGRFYVYYTDRPDANRQVSEFRVTSDPDVADPSSERVLFERAQPAEATDIRHYAGMIQFGPDGYLYVASGDGASARTHPQDPKTFIGSILRLDVDGGDPYAIPATNPFVDGVDGAPEVWAYGVRNPWRFDIDPVTNLLIMGDVGQGDIEEINVLSILGGGYNLGWANMEGSRCFFERPCNPADYTQPVVEYDHSVGCSVTGGITYRGSAIPELQGTYFYGDWCEGWIKSFRYTGAGVTDERDWTEELGVQGQLNVFGRDGDGEIIIGRMGGDLLKLVPVR